MAARADLGLGCRLGGCAEASLLAACRRRLDPANLVRHDTEYCCDPMGRRLVVGEDAAVDRALGGRVGDTRSLGQCGGRDALLLHQLTDGVLIGVILVCHRCTPEDRMRSGDYMGYIIANYAIKVNTLMLYLVGQTLYLLAKRAHTNYIAKEIDQYVNRRTKNDS